MFEHDIERIITTVRQRTIMNSPAVAVKELLAADVPHPLKTFFRANIEFMLHEELLHQRSGSRFSYDHPEVQSLQHQINSILVLNFSYPRAEFQERLDDAVHLLVNYLMRPQWTLTHFLFQKEDEIATSLLMRLLRYFGPYEYLKELILHYAQEKHITAFRQADFATFLWRADSEFIRRKNGSEFAKLLTSAYDFLAYPDGEGERALPVRGLSKFFEDKGVTTIVHTMEGLAVQGTEKLTLMELGELLEDTRRTMGIFETERPTAPAMQDAQAAGGENSAPQIVPAEPDAAQEKEPPAPPVPWEMTESDRKKIVRRVFKQDEKAFIAALYAISELATWKQASVYIDNIFIDNDVDPYASEAKKFIDIAYQRYYPKK